MALDLARTNFLTIEPDIIFQYQWVDNVRKIVHNKVTAELKYVSILI